MAEVFRRREEAVVTVTFTTDPGHAGQLAAKVSDQVARACDEGGLDIDAAGAFHDLTVLVTDATGAPVWGSEFDGPANNEGTGPDA